MSHLNDHHRMILPGEGQPLIPRKMAEIQQQTIGGSYPIRERSFQGRALGTSQDEVRGSDLNPKMTFLNSRSGADAMTSVSLGCTKV